MALEPDVALLMAAFYKKMLKIWLSLSQKVAFSAKKVADPCYKPLTAQWQLFVCATGTSTTSMKDADFGRFDDVGIKGQRTTSLFAPTNGVDGLPKKDKKKTTTRTFIFVDRVWKFGLPFI